MKRILFVLALTLGVVFACSGAFGVASAAAWTPQTSGSTSHLAGVSFPDALHGWAVGGAGTILATSDGGAHWTPQPVDPSSWLSGVSFADASHGWAVGTGEGGAIILATGDGGAHWTAQTAGEPGSAGCEANLSGVCFPDPSHGWAVGGSSTYGGTILATSDGGAHWTVQATGANFGLSAASFPDASHGWAVGMGDTILATINGGETWTEQYFRPGDVLYGVFFLDALHGWAVGGAGPGLGTILATSNGGATWTDQTTDARPLLRGVFFLDASHGWAVGESGTILATSDGGAHWTPQTSGTTNGLSAVSFPNAVHGWAVGDFGTIVATTAGGSPFFSVSPIEPAEHMWGEEWAPDSEVMIEIDDPDTAAAVDFSMPAGTDENGRFELFEIPFDIKAGHVVTVSQGATVKTHVVIDLMVTLMDPVADTVSGIGKPNTETVVHIPDELHPPEGSQRIVTSDSEGAWTADFSVPGADGSPALDVRPGMMTYTYQADEDGDQTQIDYRLPAPTFEVHRGAGGALVYFKGWTAGETLTLTIDDPATEDSPDYEATVVAEEYQWPDDGFGIGVDYDVKPGDVVTVTGETAAKSHTVTDIAVTAVDTRTDLVRGTAAPGIELQVYADAPGAFRWTSAAGGGAWVVDFSVSDDPEQAALDIVPGTRGGAEQFDADGDSTVYDWEVPRPEGWQHNPATSHDYLFVEDGVSWAEAEAHAVSLGGHLVTINDKAENDWLIATLGTDYWIGLNDMAVEGAWVWANGQPVTFAGWLSGEPNDYLGEDAAMIENRPPIGWNDVPDDSWAPFVVEASSDVTPPTIVLSPALYDGVTYGVSLLGQPLDFSVVDEIGGSGASINGSASVLVPGNPTPQTIPLTWTTNANGSTSASGTLPTDVAGTYTLTLSGQDKAGNPVTRTLSCSVAGIVSPIAGLEGLPKDESGTPLLDLPTFTPRTSLTLSFTLLDSAGKPVKGAKPRLSVWDTATGTERFEAKEPFQTKGKDKGTYAFKWFPTQINWESSWLHEYRDMQLIITFFDKKKGALVAATVQQGQDDGLVATPIPVAGALAATSSAPSTTSSKIKVRW
jgi:photosystem II stability/assembly factor-like uncharacterized protein